MKHSNKREVYEWRGDLSFVLRCAQRFLMRQCRRLHRYTRTLPGGPMRILVDIYQESDLVLLFCSHEQSNAHRLIQSVLKPRYVSMQIRHGGNIRVFNIYF